jgi:hypothetical protein
MPGEGPVSTPCSAGLGEVVDTGPPAFAGACLARHDGFVRQCQTCSSYYPAKPKLHQVSGALHAVGIVFLQWTAAVGHPLRLSDSAAASVNRTRLALQTVASAHPDWPIVLEPNLPWDYKLVYAFHVWQTFFKVTNPVLLRVEIAPKNINGSFEQWLTDQMQTWGTKELPGTFEALPDSAQLDKLDKHFFGIGYWHSIASPCVPLEFQPGRYIPRGRDAPSQKAQVGMRRGNGQPANACRARPSIRGCSRSNRQMPCLTDRAHRSPAHGPASACTGSRPPGIPAASAPCSCPPHRETLP